MTRLTLASVFLSMLLLAGCTGSTQVDPAVIAQTDRQIDEGQTAIEAIMDRIDAMSAALAQQPDPDVELIGQLDALVAKRDDAQEALNKLVAWRNSVIADDGSIKPEGVATTVAPFLPPPLGMLAIAGAGILTGLAENRRNKKHRQGHKVLGHLVHAIESTRSTDTTLDDAIKGSSLAAAMPAESAAMVKKIRSAT